MTFIKSFSINTNRKTVFPYSITAVKFAKHVDIDNGVTVFVGDNGCGKSTLLETRGLYLNISLIAGYVSSDASFEAAKKLKPFLKIKRGREVSVAFFQG